MQRAEFDAVLDAAMDAMDDRIALSATGRGRADASTLTTRAARRRYARELRQRPTDELYPRSGGPATVGGPTSTLLKQTARDIIDDVVRQQAPEHGLTVMESGNPNIDSALPTSRALIAPSAPPPNFTDRRTQHRQALQDAVDDAERRFEAETHSRLSIRLAAQLEAAQNNLRYFAPTSGYTRSVRFGIEASAERAELGYDRKDRGVVFTDGSISPAVVTHELLHGVERLNGRMQDATMHMWMRRVRPNDKVRETQSTDPRAGRTHTETEVGRFWIDYAGKFYQPGSRHGELHTMAVQHMLEARPSLMRDTEAPAFGLASIMGWWGWRP